MKNHCALGAGLLFSLLIPASALSVVSAGLSTGSVSPSLVGTKIHWTATATGADPNPTYQWTVTKPNGTTSVVVDFDVSNQFDMMLLQDGTYTVKVAVKRGGTGEQAIASAAYVATSLQSDLSIPVITATDHPLVALYSASCSAGTLRVFFAQSPENPFASGTGTSPQPCVPGKSTNVILAGMRPSSTYTIQHQVSAGFALTNGPALTFTTGARNSSYPAGSVSGTPSTAERLLLFSFIGLHGIQGMAAYDTAGFLVWHPQGNGLGNPTLFRSTAGSILGSTNPPTSAIEFDLLSNVLRKTNVKRVGEQVPAAYPVIGSFNHDMIRLPNGYTAFMVGVEKLFTDGTQGSSVSSPIDLQGSGIVVVDQNWQVVWTWDPFTKFDVTRPALFPAPCPGLGCEPVTLAATGIDWMHGNSLVFTGDNNFVMSLRHQDLLIKINYANGSGNGDILWKMGPNGDFTITNSNIDGFPWFSGQHSPTYRGNYLTVFDNGTTRIAPNVNYNFNPALCCSRGQAYTVDEKNKTVTLVTNANLGTYSNIIGTAQLLLQGNLSFLSGFANGGFVGEAREVTPAGNTVYTFDIPNSSYRGFRIRDLYTAPY